MEERNTSGTSETSGTIGSVGTTGGTTGMTGGTQNKGVKETFKQGSPEEIKEKMKEVVQKGVAAVAGALKGFNEETRRDQMPQATKEAVHQAGETARSAVGSVSEEVSNLKQPIKEAGQKIGQTARDISSTAKEETQKTRDAMKGGQGMSSGELSKPDTVTGVYYSETTIATPEADKPLGGTKTLGNKDLRDEERL